MPIYYQQTETGVLARAMSEEQYKHIQSTVVFLEDTSKQVQEYKELQAEALSIAQSKVDEQEALAEVIKEYFADKVASRVKDKQARREATK